MPYIKSFSIDRLAGRKDVTARTLNSGVNVFFGPNGSGKTSLLRILHSALLHKAELLNVGLPPWLRQTVKTLSAVRCKILDRQDHSIAF
jgi:ABC-type Na+ transport system ATPase subunit NatA